MDNTQEPPSAPRGRKHKASGEVPPALTTAALTAHALRMENAPDNSHIAPVAIRYYSPSNGARRRNGSPAYTAAAAADLATLERHVKNGLPAVTAFDRRMTYGLAVGNGPPADSTGSLGIQDLRVASSPPGPAATSKKEETMATPDAARPHARRPMPHPSRLSINSRLRFNDRFRHDPNLLIPGTSPPTVKTGDRSVYTLSTDHNTGSRNSFGSIHDFEGEMLGEYLPEEAGKDAEEEEMLMEVEEEERKEIEERTGVMQPVLDREGLRARADLRFEREARQRELLEKEL